MRSEGSLVNMMKNFSLILSLKNEDCKFKMGTTNYVLMEL